MHEQPLAILKHGTDTWNNWRRNDRATKSESWTVDLSYTDFQGEDLALIDFQKVDLSFSNLERSNLRLANLRAANLQEANLSQANLRSAYLQSTRLVKTNLQGADLSQACLERANLMWANLREVKGLFREEILKAENWRLAFYSEDLCKDLGLPKDHNERVYEKRVFHPAYPNERVYEKRAFRPAHSRVRIRDFWTLVKEYAAIHAPVIPPSQSRVLPQPSVKDRSLTVLRYLRLTNYALAGLFVISFVWDFPGISIQLWHHSLALDGLLRITSVSGLIGFLTNWLAVTMLFHPRQRRPVFGQGLIPAQRERVIDQLARTIYKNLINPQTILSRIEESNLLARYREMVLQVSRDILEDRNFREDLKSLAVDYAEHLLPPKEVRLKFAQLAIERIARHINGFRRLALRIFRFFKEDELQDMIDDAICELPQSLDPVLDQFEKLLDTLPEEIAARAEEIEKWILKAVPSFIQQIDVYGLLIANMRKLDEERLERLIKNDTSNEQFNYIKDLGGILGFFGGLVIWQPVPALIVFGVLGLSLWLLDVLLLRARKLRLAKSAESTDKQQIVA